MSTVLFAHDGYVYLTSEGIYSDTYDDKIVSRYLDIAGNVKFMVRVRDSFNGRGKLNRITIENFQVVGIDNFKSLRGILDYRAIADRVSAEVKVADYVVARLPRDLGFLAAHYARKYNKKYMVEIVGCPWDSLRSHSTVGKLLAPYYYLRQKQTTKNAPYAIYVTERFLQGRYPCSGMSLSCSDVAIEYADQTVLEKRLDRIRNTDRRSLVFGSLGSVNMKYKGYDTVIKTLVRLNREGNTHRYVVAGAGDPSWLNSVVRKYGAEGMVSILPPMPHAAVFGWLDSIDVYVQPSRTEGLPRALIEAMSRACPCVGSNAGGIPELLSDDAVFKKGSANSLYEAVLRITDSIEIMVRQGTMNFRNSKKFEKSVLDTRRSAFYREFGLQ